MLILLLAHLSAAPSHVALEAFYLKPLGPLSESYPHAAGGYGSFTYTFGERYALVMKGGYVAYDAKNEGDLEAGHFLVGPRYYFADGALAPYAGFNVGGNLVVESTAASDDHFTVQFAWQLGLGLLIPISDPIGLDLSARYNAHFYEHERMMTGFEFGAAVTFALF